MKPVVGLTGGIASGKSTVGKILTGFGVTVLDADQFSRDLTVRGSEALQAICTEFGESILTAEGELDRRALGARVFSDAAEREKLNAIMHPRIAKLSEERFRIAQDSPTPYVVYEAALLVELGTHKTLSKLIVVAAEPALQLRRVISRNNLTEAEARDRLASQFPLDKKVAVADYVIHNDDDREALVQRTRAVHEQILKLTGL